MWTFYAEMWMEKQGFMNSYSVVAQTMTFWLSCFHWVCTPGMYSSVCWSTQSVWGSEASARGWLVGFVSTDWPSAYASQSTRQLGQQCNRSHIHRLSKCLLMCVCVRFVFKQLSVSFKRHWPWRLGFSLCLCMWCSSEKPSCVGLPASLWRIVSFFICICSRANQSFAPGLALFHLRGTWAKLPPTSLGMTSPFNLPSRSGSYPGGCQCR